MQPTHTLAFEESGQTLVPMLCRAVTPWQRMRGLLGRDRLEPGEGLLIERCSSIHTCFMRFPIDVVYLDAGWRVKKKVAHLVPWRLSACLGASHTLELPAGALERAQVPTGCRLVLREGC